ncbi:MAG: biotin--[acetyl-CoA-carboxylase] ligase, partial [Deltaproteobacteria bacterium]|nr:biotin--[acetyl-CoA-carboxylase] ligase [Deltaproteobacteria bacterium]
DLLLPALVHTKLQTVRIGRSLHYYDKISSTNAVARDLIASGVEHGTVVVAEEQTSGRGRLDRQWISPPRANILCSLILYPAISPSESFQLTMLTSVAIVRAIRRICKIDAGIKWPNDVYVNGKKACGVLTEFMAEQDRIRWAVIGIGVNVNFDCGAVREIADCAVSLQQICGQAVSRLALFQAMLSELDTLYRGFVEESGAQMIRHLWESSSLVQNRRVVISNGAEQLHGTVQGIDETGQLLLEDLDGSLQTVACGDLSLRFSA